MRLTIFCSILAALGYEIMDNGYCFSANNQTGSVSFRKSEKDIDQMPPSDQGQDQGQDQEQSEEKNQEDENGKNKGSN